MCVCHLLLSFSPESLGRTTRYVRESMMSSMSVRFGIVQLESQCLCCCVHVPRSVVGPSHLFEGATWCVLKRQNGKIPGFQNAFLGGKVCEYQHRTYDGSEGQPNHLVIATHASFSLFFPCLNIEVGTSTPVKQERKGARKKDTVFPALPDCVFAAPAPAPAGEGTVTSTKKKT